MGYENKNKYKELMTIIIMIIVITLLHYSTIMSKWELHIFYRRLYYIPIILAAFRYRLKGGIITSVAVSILYAPHLILYIRGINITSLNQYFEIILFITIGIITGKLVDLHYKKEKLLEKKIGEITNLQNYTENVVDSIDGAVISIDKDFNITSVNRNGKSMFNIGSHRENIKITDILKDSKILDILNQVKVQKSSFKDINTEIEINDEKLYLTVNFFPLFDILDRFEGIVLVIQDKSKEKNFEAQAIRADRLATVGELASGVAHEIRNPLGIIKTTSQVIKEDIDDYEIKEGLEIIESEIDRANKVVKSLLNYAKPKEINKEKVNIKNLLEEVIVIINKYAKKQDVNINTNIYDSITIKGDKEQLKQVFINIILNAVQAIVYEGTIVISLLKEGEWVNIKIKDTGNGISKDNLKKIFNPFYTTKEEGTGLGLSIVNRIIGDHRGYIAIDSVVGNGTVVDVYLPINESGGDKDEKDNINS